ncbi:MAG: hypothetical protein COA78_08785 [Blastopirellula sp.]|nr:MAG: hypothetical protein COA78_08785 [Blastopirellula sp.]
MNDPFHNSSDGEIIEAVLSGQREQFAVIVQRYRKALLRLANQQLGHPQLAEDVVQETFLNAFRWLNTYDSRYSFRTWLWTILKNACHRAYEQSSRRIKLNNTGSRSQKLIEQISSNELSALEQLTCKEDHEHVRLLLDQLSDLQAEAVKLRFFGQMKFKEIADLVGCSLPAAKARVRQGLIHLTEFIERDQFQSQAELAQEIPNDV